MLNPSEVPVFLLCGGFGTRFREQTEFRPKPMIEIGNRPIVWHIMQSYARHGFKKFILCLGYRAEVVKDYFLHYAQRNSDFTVGLCDGAVTTHSIDHAEDWTVTLADTGEGTMTGGRVARAAERYLGDAEHFAVSYGDGVTDADLTAELEFHREHGRIGTVLGVNPPSRFGEIQLAGDRVERFEEKPEFTDTWINGGYFFFRRNFLEYLKQDEACVLEREPLVQLAADDQMSLFRHHGFWQCMDTQRDHDGLNKMWMEGKAPWAK
ncbi:Glucose-1-phosphate cytidylyltransferase [Botrimarina colliarenosi]|uniref:Glucose-1-phosphate cytidylyltransferase n=1 Tax=Botrimarina colliarenosi TaxID=2528001 RepID=A0A5C6AHF2_9BACT|nr:glucose-1-phosphate cytidylyltransferase [Botrimarina colliarenosi]TWT97603.1 Glucose-1-phosphate cytidylyltransferase [Botrimarina colliarenosi]